MGAAGRYRGVVTSSSASLPLTIWLHGLEPVPSVK